MCLVIIAALLDERESEAGHLHEGVVDYFKDELKECLECDDDDNRSPRKIVRSKHVTVSLKAKPQISRF